MATNAEAVARALVTSGVEYIFGLPGGEIVALMEACRQAGVRFYLTGHEASAAFMAEVTGQITGRPGVCMATLGPGAMNLVLGVSNALLDRAPVVALTAELSTATIEHFPHQRLPLSRVFGAVCKASATLDGRGTEQFTGDALRLASTPPWGPVHLALPSDVALREEGSGTPETELHRSTEPPMRGSLEDVRDMLAAAQRPLLVAGVGCLPSDVPALRRFVDQTAMPYVVTPKAKGVLSERAAEFLGVVGGMAIDKAVMETVDQSDFLLGIGFDPVECDKDWYVNRRIANLTRAPTCDGTYRPSEVIGEIGASLDVLSSSVGRHGWPEEMIKAAHDRLNLRPRLSSEAMSPLEAIRVLRSSVPQDTVLTSDVGSHKYYAGQFWETSEPHSFFMSNGLSAMGYGIPAAIAAKLVFPARPVVALVGDGGFLMTMHNLVFLRQYGIHIVIVCFVDESLSLIGVGQRRRGLEAYGVDFPAPDLLKIAEGFGIAGIRVSNAQALERAVRTATSTQGAVVISVPVDKAEYEIYC
jgi:acetolactate synthase-1/2/3 large subunit